MKKFFFFISLNCCIFGAIYSTILYTSFTRALEKKLSLTISSGDTLLDVYSQLEEKQLQVPPLWQVKLLFKLLGPQASIHFGSYSFDQEASILEVFRTISKPSKAIKSLTIIPGSNKWEFMESLAQSGLQLPKNAKPSEDTLLKSSGVDYKSIEGLILADTYNFSPHYPLPQFIRERVKTSLAKLEHIWESIPEESDVKKVLNNSYELLILSSIVEKETSLVEERSLIASVFLTRLEKNMRLQTDPTVIYGIGKDFDGDIKKADLITPTAYNTYTMAGLPPTPISMVSVATLEATAKAGFTPFLFFVADGSGGHHFTTNYRDHNKAVQKYILKKK